MHRRLTTIVAADVAGYSRLIGLDEEGTLAALRGHREALIDPLLEQHGGRIANTAGDSLLIEFPSAVEAVRCAMAVQEGMAGRNTDVPEDRRIEFRVGINVGDVVDQDGDLLGDGVNIAARLEAQAPPGGIVLSRAVRDQIRDRLDLNLADLGEIEVKNITRPVRAFQVVTEGAAPVALRASGNNRRRHWAVALVAVVALIAGLAWWQWQKPDFARADPAKMIYSLPDEPSIAVLAFKNLTGDAEQEHFSDGISEDIIAALSHLPGVLAIARNSAFSYKGRDVDVRQIAEEMSVRYVLEGSLYQSGETLRITAQLIDAVSGHLIWSEKYDRTRDDFFKIRDDITERVVKRLDIEIAEGDSFNRGLAQFDSLDTWLLGRRAIWHGLQFTAEDNQIAIDLLNEILKREPDSVMAHVRLAFRYTVGGRNGWGVDRAEMFERAEVYAKKAIELDGTYAGGYSALAYLRRAQKRIEDAIALGEKALTLAPNDSYTMANLASIYRSKMNLDRAIQLYERITRVDREAPAYVWTGYGLTQQMAGQYEKSIPALLEAVRSARGALASLVYAGLAVSYDVVGEDKKAKEAVAAAVKAHDGFSIAYYRRGFSTSFGDKAYFERYLATLKRLGVPEE